MNQICRKSRRAATKKEQQRVQRMLELRGASWQQGISRFLRSTFYWIMLLFFSLHRQGLKTGAPGCARLARLIDIIHIVFL